MRSRYRTLRSLTRKDLDHLATVAAAYWPRDFSGLPPATNRLFEVEAGTRDRADGVPTLILAAEDDPLVPITSFRKLGTEENPFITLVVPEHGTAPSFRARAGMSVSG